MTHSTAVNERPSILAPGRRISCRGVEFEIAEFIKRGGTSEIYRARWGDIDYAVKLYLPNRDLVLAASALSSGEVVDAGSLLKMQADEYGALETIQHPNVVRVWGHGFLALTERESRATELPEVADLPFLIMEYVDGQTLSEAVATGHMDARQVARALYEVASALDCIHEVHHLLHFDVHASNVLIERHSRRAVLIDFGSVKNVEYSDETKGDLTNVFVDLHALPEHHALLAAMARGQRGKLRRDELRELCFPHLDLYGYGRMLNALGSDLEDILPADELDYVRYVASNLTGWESVRSHRGGISRIMAKCGLDASQFLAPGPTEPHREAKSIPLPGGVSVLLDGVLLDIFNTPSFRRLNYIRQLSLVVEIYPGASYVRSLHALYALQLARLFTQQLLRSPEFRYLFEPIHVRQMLVLVLLHDINHFPFLHILQEARVLKNAELTRMFCDGKLTGEAASGRRSVDDLLKLVGMDRLRFNRLAFGKHREQKSSIDEIMNSIISSGADIDKIAYLTQDSIFSGVPFGQSLPVDALASAARVSRIGTGRYHLSYDDRARDSVEAVFMARLWNFRKIYWHHTNRAVMAMVLSVVRALNDADPEAVIRYVRETVWLDDYAALDWLNQEHRRLLDEPSILEGIRASRGVIFKRLYTVRAQAGAPTADNDLYDSLTRFLGSGDLSRELALRASVAAGMSRLYPELQADACDILIDVPRRDGMNNPGEAYVVLDGAAVSIGDASQTTGQLSADYDRMSQRVRVFIAPRLASVVTPAERRENRSGIRAMLMAALTEARDRADGDDDDAH